MEVSAAFKEVWLGSGQNCIDSSKSVEKLMKIFLSRLLSKSP